MLPTKEKFQNYSESDRISIIYDTLQQMLKGGIVQVVEIDLQGVPKGDFQSLINEILSKGPVKHPQRGDVMMTSRDEQKGNQAKTVDEALDKFVKKEIDPVIELKRIVKEQEKTIQGQNQLINELKEKSGDHYFIQQMKKQKEMFDHLLGAYMHLTAFHLTGTTDEPKLKQYLDAVELQYGFTCKRVERDGPGE